MEASAFIAQTNLQRGLQPSGNGKLIYMMHITHPGIRIVVCGDGSGDLISWDGRRHFRCNRCFASWDQNIPAALRCMCARTQEVRGGDVTISWPLLLDDFGRADGRVGEVVLVEERAL